ncbi:MAG TPA: hypothetical protein VGC78_13630, partial [Gaiellaceae bacterium]
MKVTVVVCAGTVSVCEPAVLNVTVGGALYVTVLSVLVEAVFPLPAASCAAPAAIVAITVPLCVMPETATL